MPSRVLTTFGFRKNNELTKMAASPDMDNVEFSVTFKSEKSMCSDSESTILNDSGEEASDNDDSEDEYFISNVKCEVINSTTVQRYNGKFKSITFLNYKKLLDPNNKNSNDSWRFSASSNTINVKKNIDKPIKMKQPEYLCMRTLGTKRFRKNKNIINKCRCCNRLFGSGRNKIEHILRDHMKLKELRVLQCMYCLNQEGKSKKFFDISSVQDHYRDFHKFPIRGCPINLAHDYKGEKHFIHVNESVDFLAQYEIQFVKCFIEKVGKKNKYSRI
uniref:C2H2-type domain-containing protein n=1 Tax=Strongyloides papillosus TaxID=174720 RepID=A0A0N5CAW0_STREA